MAIIYSYPYVNTVNNSDTLVISVSDTTADNGFLTKSLTADDLASYVTARVNLNFLGDTGTGVVNLDTQNLTISGTANEIETAASSQTLQIGLPDSVTITNNLTVGNNSTIGGTLNVTGQSTLSSVNVTDLTSGRVVLVGTSGELEDSSGLTFVGNSLTVGNNLTIGGDFVGDNGAFGNDLFVSNDLTVNGVTETNTLQVNSTSSMGGALNMTLNNINNVADPVAAQDAATKSYVDTAVTGLLEFKGTFRADTGEILSGGNAGAYIYNCPGGGGARVAIAIGDYYIVANVGGQFYCSGDLLQVGDSIVASQDAGADSSTINDWGILEGDNIEGTGLANTVPLWTDSQILGNSMLSQDAGATKVTISGALDVSSSLINNVLDPVAAQDAATKAYVDTKVDGTGTTQTLPVWSDGPAGVLGDSGLSQTLNPDTTVSTVTINTNASGNATNYVFGSQAFSSPQFDFKSNGLSGGYYRSGNFRFEENLAVGRTNDPVLSRLDVGTSADSVPAAFFRNGVVISNNPTGVQVDNTSMVIGAGNNDNVSGSDHCLIVGSGNQITSNSDQSVAFGQGNTITSSTDAFAVGNSNTITSSQRTLALGYDNSVDSASSFISGGSNTITNGTTNLVVGYSNTVSLNKNFVVGELLNSSGDTMVLGYRNYTTGYPTPNKNLGLGDTKFVVAVGSATTNIADNNAIIITEGGINGGNTGAVPQIPRVILPSIPTLEAANDAAADAIGVPEGGLYSNQGLVQINRGNASTSSAFPPTLTVSGGSTIITPNENLFIGPIANNVPNLNTTNSFGSNVVICPTSNSLDGPTGLTTGNQNVIIGTKSASSLIDGGSNVVIGSNTLRDNFRGSNIVAIGTAALQFNTAQYSTGNTAVGYYAGRGSLSGRYGTFLGWRAGWNTNTTNASGDNIMALGYDAHASSATASNEITLGNTSIATLRCAVTSITSLSDERDKKDITDLEYGLDFIESLQPKQFVWDHRPETTIDIDEDGNEIEKEIESANKGKKDFGFIAQDVQALDNDILRLVYDENPDKLEMSYGKLVPILVKAVKELSDKVKALENA